MQSIEQENKILKAENQRLLMKLNAIKAITQYERSICLEKLQHALHECECKGDDDASMVTSD